jgi:hypothetical protein
MRVMVTVQGRQRAESTAVPVRRKHRFNTPTLKPRLDSILRWLQRNTTEADLFSASCLFAEIIAQNGRPKPSDAMKLLEQAAQDSGLPAKLGKDGVRRTIANGLRHVEEKLLAD